MKFKPLALMVCLAILTAGWWISPQNLPQLPLCLFRYFFDFDCPGCGLTRAFLFLARGNVVAAVRLNAAAPLIYFLFITYAVALFRELRKLPPVVYPSWVVSGYSAITVGVLFGHWFWKLFFIELHTGLVY